MHKVPKYRGIRILIIPIILYYMLISPMIGMLYVTNYPKLLNMNVKDFVFSGRDSLARSIKVDSLVDKRAKAIDTLIIDPENDTVVEKSGGLHLNIEQADNKGYFDQGEELFFNLFLVSLLLGFLFSVPYKIYFRRKRKGLSVPVRIVQFCRKTIIYSPFISAAIISIPFIAQNLNLINELFISKIIVEVNGFSKRIFCIGIIFFLKVS